MRSIRVVGGFAFVSWALIMVGYGFLLAGGLEGAWRFWYMRTDPNPDDLHPRGNGELGGVPHENRPDIPSPPREPAPAPLIGQRFGYAIKVNCLQKERAGCGSKDRSMLDHRVGNKKTMGDVHKELEWFVVFPAVNLGFFFACPALLVIAYQRRSEWYSNTPDSESHTALRNHSGGFIKAFHSFSGSCLGLSIIFLTTVAVETILRYYFIHVRAFWLPESNKHPIYNNRLQAGFEWTLALASVLWLHFVPYTILKTKLPDGKVLKLPEGNYSLSIFFLLIPCGYIFKTVTEREEICWGFRHWTIQSITDISAILC